MLPHIFELFVQVDQAPARSHGGLGIGLTLVKNLVEMHGGTIEAHSEGLGKGSEFVVRLPLANRPDSANRGQNGDEQANAAATPAAANAGRRLLVVDDNHDAANSLAMLLKLKGHNVRVAYNGVGALEAAAAHRPEAVFLDIGMPGMDGYEVARRIRELPGLTHVTLTALTGWGQQQDRCRTAEAGFNHHLVKPPDSKTIDNLLAELNDQSNAM
jgi:CheY-like chemotaxis protein